MAPKLAVVQDARPRGVHAVDGIGLNRMPEVVRVGFTHKAEKQFAKMFSATAHDAVVRTSAAKEFDAMFPTGPNEAA